MLLHYLLLMASLKAIAILWSSFNPCSEDISLFKARVPIQQEIKAVLSFCDKFVNKKINWPKDLHAWCLKKSLFASNSLDKLFKIFLSLCKYFLVMQPRSAVIY